MRAGELECERKFYGECYQQAIKNVCITYIPHTKIPTKLIMAILDSSTRDN